MAICLFVFIMTHNMYNFKIGIYFAIFTLMKYGKIFSLWFSLFCGERGGIYLTVKQYLLHKIKLLHLQLVQKIEV